MVDSWEGCYDDGWQGLIVPEAFSHPAKFSRGLIHRIYQHAKEQGWLHPGDTVLDPFGGVALGGLEGLSMGLHWIGVELEEKFVSLGQQNIELWNRQLKGWPNLGTARIIQGDSRRLKDSLCGVIERFINCTSHLVTEHRPENRPLCAQAVSPCCRWLKGTDEEERVENRDSLHSEFNLGVIEQAGLIVSSPPYSETGLRNADDKAEIINRIRRERGQIKGGIGRSGALGRSFTNPEGYGSTPGNIANLPEGKFEAIISSPPYAESVKNTGDGIDWKKAIRGGHKPGMPRYASTAGVADGYGESSGQLGQMKEGEFSAIVSSPPYSDIRQDGGSSRDGIKGLTNYSGEPRNYWPTQRDQKNLGNVPPDTFWSASKEIVQGCFDLLKPGGHAIWVVKSYVKGGKIVDFPGRWRALCESVGFRMVCEHRAMLVKSHGAQINTAGECEEISTERKSFFRRLAEKKGSPRIDWECVQCMEKSGRREGRE